MQLSLENLKKFTLGVLKGSFANKASLDKIGEAAESQKLTYNTKEYATAEEIKDFSDRIDKLNYAQKIVEPGVNDYVYASINKSTAVSFSRGLTIPFIPWTSSLENNTIIYNNDNTWTLKKGNTYDLSLDVCTYNGYPVFTIHDFTNNTELFGIHKPGVSYNSTLTTNTGRYIFKPEEDTIVGIKCHTLVAASNLATSSITENSYFIIKNISLAQVDTLEHVDASEGLEDTPVGHIIPFMGNSAPKHYLICDGSEYNIDDYKYLAQHFKDEFGSANHFGGDGTTTFAVPDLRGEFLRGIIADEVSGVHTDEGLPNITASAGIIGNGASQAYISVLAQTGAFYQDAANMYTRDAYTTGANSNRAYPLKMDASRSNSIYGNSEHVTPTNTSVLYCIKYEPTYFLNLTGYIQEDILFEGHYDTNANSNTLATTGQEMNHDYTDYDELIVTMKWYDATHISFTARTIDVKELIEGCWLEISETNVDVNCVCRICCSFPATNLFAIQWKQTSANWHDPYISKIVGRKIPKITG